MCKLSAATKPSRAPRTRIEGKTSCDCRTRPIGLCGVARMKRRANNQWPRESRSHHLGAPLSKVHIVCCSKHLLQHKAIVAPRGASEMLFAIGPRLPIRRESSSTHKGTESIHFRQLWPLPQPDLEVRECGSSCFAANEMASEQRCSWCASVRKANIQIQSERLGTPPDEASF